MMNILTVLKKIAISSGILVFAAWYAAGEGNQLLVTVQMSYEPEQITIGDTFTLTIAVTGKEGIVFEPFDPATHLTSFEIKDFIVENPKKSFGKEQRIYRYKLSTFISGTYQIPSFEIPYKKPGGALETVRSPELVIEIKPVTPREGEGDDIRDLKPLLRVPVSWWVIVLVIILLAGSAVVWLMLYIRKQRALKNIQEAYEDIRPPHEIAFQRLAELRAHGLLEKGKIKEFYIILSEILRRYVERRFNIPVMDKTTYELFRDMRRHETTKKHSAEIKDFLMQCDLVKFAKYIPDQEEIDADFEHARTIVDKTKEIVTKNVVSHK